MKNRFYIETDNRTEAINDSSVNTVDNGFFSEVMKYKRDIKDVITYNLTKYKKYLSDMSINKDCLFIDTGYYGHTVYYLSKILGERLQGFYFTVNREKTNTCVSSTDIRGCFQQSDDKNAHDTGVYRMGGLFDAYLTAPNGMFIGFDEKGRFRFSKKMHNQLDFAAREEINHGVIDFIKAIMYVAGDNISGTPFFSDAVFKTWFETGTTFGKKITSSLYFDNLFSQNGEYQIL